MIELKDRINWNNFLAELKPPGWYKRREGEGNVDWIKRVAIKDTNSLERHNERKRNRYWNKESSKFCLSVLSFLRENYSITYNNEFEDNLSGDILDEKELLNKFLEEYDR